MALRVELIASRAGGKARAKCASKKKQLRQTTARQARLVAPKGKFWFMDLYEKHFGDPSSVENKKKGHKLSTFGSFTGVAVPGEENREVPWDIDLSYLDETALDDVQAEQLEGEIDDFGDTLGNQFDDLNRQADEDLANAMAGQSFEEQMAEIAEKEALRLVRTSIG